MQEKEIDVLAVKLADALTPGYEAEFDPDEAESVGAFVENALSESDAKESNIDLPDVLNLNALVVKGGDHG